MGGSGVRSQESGRVRLTWAAELGEEEAVPRGEVVGGEGAVAVAHDVSGGDEEAVPGAVDDESERSVFGQVNVVFDQGELLENGAWLVIVGDGNLADAAVDEGDEESAVEIVPLGALAEPAVAVVVVDVGGGGGQLQGDEIRHGDGRH